MSLPTEINARFGDYVIRQATPNDYQAIMDINNNVHDGLDYLPTMYYQFLQSKRDLMLVIEDRDGPMFVIIAGFDDADPTTVRFMAGRLSPANRNRGFFRTAREITYQLFSQYFPQVTREMYMTNMEHMKPSFQEALYRVICIGCPTSTDAIRCGLVGQQTTTVQCPQKVTFQQIDDILTHSNQIEQFLSRYAVGYIVGLCNWRAIKIHDKHELRGMFAAASAIVLTSEDDDLPGPTNGLERAPVGKTSKIISLSFSFAYPVKAGLALSIVFFGDDPSLIRQHELEQVKHLTNVYKGDVYIVLALPHKLAPEEVLSNVVTTIGKHEYFPSYSNVLLRGKLIRKSKL